MNAPLYPAGVYLLKFNNRNTRTRCEICSKLTIKIPFHKHFSHLLLVFLLLEQVNAGWVMKKKKKKLAHKFTEKKMKRCLLIKTLGSCSSYMFFISITLMSLPSRKSKVNLSIIKA